MPLTITNRSLQVEALSTTEAHAKNGQSCPAALHLGAREVLGSDLMDGRYSLQIAHIRNLAFAPVEPRRIQDNAMRTTDSGKRRISYQPLARATIVALCTLLAVTPAANGQQLVGRNIQIIDAGPLGSLSTDVWGINDAGDIVGTFYWTNAALFFGFQLSHAPTGTYTMGYSPVIPPRTQDNSAWHRRRRRHHRFLHGLRQRR